MKTWNIAILCFLFVGVLVLGFSLKKYLEYPYQKVRFSDTLYEKERAVVRQMFAEDISESKRVIGFDDIDISIAKYDLNQDGIKDIFVMLNGRSFCGSQGCWTMIYIIDKRGFWHKAYDFNTYPLWGISSRKHNGYFDLVRVGPVDGQPISDCFLLKYEWKNGHYEGGIGYRKLNKRDLEVFKDEILR